MARLLASAKRRILQARIRQLTRRDWKGRHREVFERNPSYRRHCPPTVEEEHLGLWRGLWAGFSLDTLRVCHGISGKAVAQIVPEETYATEIEPRLNCHRECAYLANKSTYDRWFSPGLFPEVFLHNIEDELYGGDYRRLSASAAEQLLGSLPYPVVIKPAIGPGGGRGVFFPEDRRALETRMAGASNYVVQRLIRQHECLARFNRAGLNTVRICTYRSVVDNSVNVLNASLRMGKGGSLDNETAGGLVCALHPDGRLNDYAVDKYGTKYREHPDTGIEFSANESLPDLEAVLALARRTAGEVYRARLVSLDACYDESGAWRLIEINLFGQTIRFSQYAGRPFFGTYTAEVIDYCTRKVDH